MTARSAPRRVLAVDPPRPVATALAAAGDVAVTTVDDADRAREHLDEGDVDCVVCGHRDAGVDGVALATRVGDEVPVVLAPHRHDGEVASRAVAAGVAEYVPPDGDVDPVERVRAAVPAPRVDGGTVDATSVEAELALKEQAMDEAPVGITLVDPDREDNPLVYINESFERLTGYDEAEVLGRNCRFLQGEDSDPEAVAEMREAIAAERPVSVELRNYRKDGEQFWNKVDIAPLRDEDGEVSHFVGFQTDVTERKRAELEAAQRAADLDHVLSRVNGLLEDLTESLVQSSSRAEAERLTCERLVASDPYTFAWLGGRDLGSDVVRARTWAGGSGGPFSATVDPDGDHPAARALSDGSAVVVTDLTDRPDLTADVPTESPPAAMAALPLVYRNTTYGVLAVYADSEAAFEGRETAVLEAMGRVVATAVNALESRRVLTTDDVAELEVTVRDAALFPLAVANATDARLDYAGASARPGGQRLLFFAVEGATADDVLAASADRGVDANCLADRGEECLVEFEVPDDSLTDVLADSGAELQDLTATGGEARIRLTVPTDGDPRSVVAALEERYGRVDLVARRERHRPPQTRQEYLASVHEQLTERQRTALQKAYVSGYFDRSRAVTGEELAESMGISRATFHEHLRAGQRKLLGEFFDG